MRRPECGDRLVRASSTEPFWPGGRSLCSTASRVRSLKKMLEEEREARTEERRRHDTLMAQLMQRIPELEAPARETSEDAETVEEAPEGWEPRSDALGPQEGARRPWWRRVFGG